MSVTLILHQTMEVFMKKILGVISLFIATFGGAGMVLWLFGLRGKGGGLMGSLAISIILTLLYPCSLSPDTILLMIIISFLLGIIAIYFSERFMLEKWGPRKRHNGEIVDHDFNETCIDEVNGMLLAVLPIYLVPLSFQTFLILHVIALITFRIIDTKKPGPVKLVEDAEETLTRPVAIMLDDTVGGLMAGMVVTFFTAILV